APPSPADVNLDPPHPTTSASATPANDRSLRMPLSMTSVGDRDELHGEVDRCRRSLRVDLAIHRKVPGRLHGNPMNARRERDAARGDVIELPDVPVVDRHRCVRGGT